MKRIKRFANRMLAVMLAGTLTAGSLSLSVYGAEDAGSTAVPETEILYDEANEDRMTESSPTEEISEEVMTETSEGGFWDASESAAEDDAVVSYTITLDANGGYFADEWDDVLDKKLENTGILNKIIPVGGTVSTVPVNEKEDTTATFLGWSFEPDGELLPQEQEGYAPVGDGVLYAVWGYEDAAEDADAVEGTDENEFEKDSSDLDASDTSNAEGEANLESEIEEAPADETVEDENARDTEVTYTVTFDANGGYFDNESVHEQEQTVIDDVSGEPELSDTNVNDSSINGNAEGENSGNLDEVSPDNVQTVRSEESKPDANAVIQADPDLSYSEKKSDPELADAELSDEIEQVIPERASYAGTNPSCVVGFWGGHKYQIFEEDTSPIEAQKICTSLGGYLVTITSAEEQAFIGRLADLGVSDGYTIGGTDIEQEGVWTWVTGEPWNYTNWYPGGSAGTYEPNNGMGAGEDYLYISKSRNWNWVDWYGEYDNYEGTNPFICEWDSGNSSLDDHIYKRFDEFKTWTDAEVYCESLGGHLATITSSEENNRVLDISQSGSKNAYWIGARIEENGEASWVTHELLSYTNWANDEPDDYQTKQGYVFLFGEDYISSKYYVGQWGDIAENGMSWNNDSFWGSSNFGFLCEWDYILGLTMELSSRDKEKNYTGSEIKPLPTVRSKEGKILFNGYDYTLSYENNIDPGLATIIATGTGDYEGQSASISFKILDVVNISLDSEIEGIVDEDLPISAEIKSGHFVPSSSNMSWSVTGPKGSNENLPEIGPMEIVKDSGNTFVLSSIFHFSKAGEYTVTLSSDQGDSASATITVTPESVLKITQPVGGKKLYSYAGDVQAEKQFSMTLDKADKQPKASDFHFSVKKSDDLRNKPTNEVSGSNAEVKSIKKVGDRKYEIFFSYKPDDTGFYGLTVTYKDNKDDTELMVYDSQFLDKLEKDFDKEIKNYIKSYGKRLKSEANSLRKEDDNSIDYLLLAKDLKKDSSNILTGSGIGDLGTEKADVESLDNCAYEALARYLQKAGSKAGVKFDKVDNDTAASMIVQRITNIIIIDDDLKNVTLDSKATLGSNKYTVKVNTHIYPGGNGSVTGQINLFVQTQDRGEKSYSYYVKMGNKNSVEAAVADFLDALNDLNIDAQRNVAEQWYEELKDLLEWDFISDIEKSKEEYFEELSEDIAGGLERHGLTKIIDKIKVYRNYYKKYTGIIEKIKKAKTVLKKGLSGEQTSLSEIESIEINSGESGEYSKEIYDLMIKAEGKWKEYMKEYFTTGTIQDLETDNLLDTCKNGIKSYFKCPVSITVIDPSGNEVGYVGDDDIWFDDPVFIEEEGDSKIIYTPKTAGYHFDVVGTDYGLVSYTVSELTDGNPSEGYLNYYDIPVEEGSHIYIETLSDSIQSEEDIKVVCEEEAYEPETAKISSAVQVSLTNDPEKGTVAGEGFYRAGDKVTVKAFPAEDYYFAGWYEDDDFKSLSDEYQFEVRRDTVLTAAYELKADLLVSDDKIEILKQGSCGNNAVWTFDSSGTFRVSGKGQMTDYTFTDYSNGKIPWDSVKGEVERVIIEDGITTIGDQSFYGFLNLESVTVPESVRSLGDYSFGSCSSLKEINLPDTITYISDCAFVSSGLQEIRLPASCTHIGLCAFSKCKDLVRVEFCSAPYMETNVFQSCENLQEVILKTGTEKIYQGTFHSCKGLRRIMIPKGTTTIEKAAFMLDTSLTDIYIPGSVSEIDTEAFSGANKDLVIHCERGSEAEKFAIEKGFSYDDSIYGHEHQYIKKVIQPTCTKKGHTVYNCDLCDVSYEDEYVEALGHSWLNWTISGEGIKSRVCARCGMEETESPRKNIADAVITGIKDTVYKGKTVTYTPKVRFGTKLLEEGTDYDLSFSDNENVGTAVAVITGIGSYKGTTVRQFEIRPKEITPDLSLDKKTFTYNGKVQKPAITVKDGDNVLTASDYTVIYPSGCINAGSYELTVKMKGNYTGVKTAAFKINKTAQTITVKAGVSSFAVGKTTSVSITGNKGTKSYKSSNTAIATVSSTGKVTARKVGTVKITATSAATANYNSASKTVTIKVVPAATASLTAANQPSGIKLTWKKVTGANGYKVYRGSTLIKTITSGSTVTYADTAANTNGTKYTYKLVAKSSTGDSNLSKSVAVYRIARPALASVTNSAASKMTVKWGKNAKAAVYHIQYSTSSTFASGNKAAIIAGASTISYDIGGLTKGKTYYVRIRTYMIVGNILYWSEWSPVKSVKISK